MRTLPLLLVLALVVSSCCEAPPHAPQEEPACIAPELPTEPCATDADCGTGHALGCTTARCVAGECVAVSAVLDGEPCPLGPPGNCYAGACCQDGGASVAR